MTALRPMELEGLTPETATAAVRLDVGVSTGSASVSIPIPLTAGRDGFGPALSLTHGGHDPLSPFPHGWSLSGLPSIELDSRRGLPRHDGSDTHRFAGAELVPMDEPGRTTAWREGDYDVRVFRPRLETATARVERWTERGSRRVHWRARSPDGGVMVFGRSGEARIEDGDRTFRWLLEASFDRLGNAMWVRYRPENDAGVDPLALDGSRFANATANRYVDRILYGNAAPLAVDDALEPARWHFEAVLDYGGHDAEPTPARPWPVRPDVGTTGRPGFEVRTRRLCRRVMMFHRFAEELGAPFTLVGTLELRVHEAPEASTLEAVRYVGHRGSERIETPWAEVSYTTRGGDDAFEARAAPWLSSSTRLADLRGEGVAGLLTLDAGTAWYSPNHGAGYEAPQPLSAWPRGLPAAALEDFDQDGDPEWIVPSGPEAGFYRFDRRERRWSALSRFDGVPSATGAAVSRADLTGDGRADLIVWHDSGAWLYESLGAEGFAAPVDLAIPHDRTPKPALALDRFLADMTGDGLADVVEVLPGAVRYWPSLGRGRFGEPVVMDDAPWLDREGSFDASRVFLIDLDGSGGADLIYLRGDGAVLRATNRRGASFGSLEPFAHGAPVPCGVRPQLADVHGDGSVCLAWVGPSGAGDGVIHALRLVRSPGARRVETITQPLGAVTTLRWGHSLAHYQRDVASGRGWDTPLPTHRAVLDAVEHADPVDGVSRGERFQYHDGVYDPLERAFAVFACVEHLDADPEASPEIEARLTRQLFHSGDLDFASRFAQHHYAGDLMARPPPSCAVIDGPPDLFAHELEAAGRALAGALIRTETFAADARGAPSDHPFHVEHFAHAVRPTRASDAEHRVGVQRFGTDAWTFDYEQQPADPRVTVGRTLRVDPYLLPELTTTAGLPRRPGPLRRAPQARLLATASRERRASFDTPQRFEVGVPIDSRSYEVRYPSVDDALAEDLAQTLDGTLDRARGYADTLAPGAERAARELSHERSLYWDDDALAPLPFGGVGAVTLPHHDETAVYDAAQLARHLGARVDPTALTSLGFVLDGGVAYAPSPVLDYYGPERFRRLRRATAADGSTQRSTPDDANLVLASVIDEVGNEARAEIDHHVVAPWRVTDPNGTVEEVQRDALGVVRRRTRHGTVLDGDGAEVPHGFGPIARSAPPSLAIALADPLAALADQGALHAYAFGAAPGEPLITLEVVAEQFVNRGPDPGDAPARAQVVVTYHDGFGQALQERTRVEDGDAWGERGGAWVEAPSADRWRASGYVERDAKLRPVAVYEPFFVDGSRYDAALERRRVGVASVTTYDALDRPVREAHPNETFADTRFTPWARTQRDPNDTAEEATAYRAARAGLDATEPERLALEQALATAGTPVTVHYDALGREVAVSEVIEGGRVLEEVADLEIRGLSERTTDRRGRTASTRTFDRLGRALFEWSMDAGETRVLHDALGREVRSWRSPVEVGGDETEHRRAYDAAGRLRAVRLIEGAIEAVVERYHYRHASPEAARRNQNARVVAVEDGAGQLTFARYGAFGEILESARTLTEEAGLDPDWSGEVPLETRAHRSVRAHDALGREVRAALPDGSVRETRYLRSGPASQRSLTTPDGVRRPILRDARYNARGQPERVELGNGVVIASRYDPETFRLQQRTAAAEGEAPLQDLRHAYDPVGNLVHLDDRAQRPGAERVIRGLTVGAHRTFRYDARYQLVGATGRLHRALVRGDYRGDAPPPGSFRGSKRAALNDGHEVSRYARAYTYDDAGVLEGWTHRPDWAERGDRLSVEKWVDPRSHRSIPRYDVHGLPESDPGGHFDARGQLTWLATMRRMEWSPREKLRRVVLIERGAGEPPDDERYDYAADGTRVRKIRRRRVAQATETVETVYLDGCELRRVVRSSERIVRWTAHVEDGGHRIASVYHWEFDRLGTETDDPAAVRTHYLLSDQVGSVSLELGARREYLSYEEHFPFGRTAFVAGDAVREMAMRTLRFAHKNQDDATGFYCFQHRYYAPFIGNWVSPDPAGEVDGPNRYAYAQNNPVNRVDPDGLQSVLAVGPPIEDEGEAIEYYNRTYARFLMRVITDLEPVEGESGQWRVPEGGHREMSPAEWESQLGSSRVTALTRIEGGGNALPPPGATTGAPPEAPAGGGGDGDEGVGSLATDPEALERDLDALAALDVGDDPLAGLPGGGEGEAAPTQPGGHGRGNGGGGGGDPGRGPGAGRAGIGSGAGRGIGEEGEASGRGRGFGQGTHGDRPEGGVLGGSEAGRGRRPGGSPNGRDPRPGGGGRSGGQPGQRVPLPPGARVGERAIPGVDIGTTTGTGTTPHDTSGSDIGATGGSDAGSHLGSASGGANGDLLSGGEGGEHEATFEDSVNALVGIATGEFAGYDPQDPNANENGVTGGVLGLFDFGEATPYIAAGAAIFMLLFGRLGAAKRAVQETLEQIGDAVGRWFRGARGWLGDMLGRARRWFSRTEVPNAPHSSAEPMSWGGEFADDGLGALGSPGVGTPDRGPIGPRLGSRTQAFTSEEYAQAIFDNYQRYVDEYYAEALAREQAGDLVFNSNPSRRAMELGNYVDGQARARLRNLARTDFGGEPGYLRVNRWLRDPTPGSSSYRIPDLMVGDHVFDATLGHKNPPPTAQVNDFFRFGARRVTIVRPTALGGSHTIVR